MDFCPREGGGGRSMKLYGKCRFSGYHSSSVPEQGIKIDQQKSVNGL